jgi:CheY-like chemotaxis protein
MEQRNTRGQAIKVLVVEDEVLISEWVKESLIEDGFVVEAVATARAALEIIDSDADLDVLFTDINLPGEMDGAVLARIARMKRPDLTVVYASGRMRSLDPRVSVPGSTFIPKPYMPSQVSSLLARIVGLETSRRLAL